MMKFLNLLILVLILSGCNLFDSSTKDIEQNFMYPFSVGNSWQYCRTITTEYDELGISNGLDNESYTNTAIVEVYDHETILKNLDVFNLQTTINENGQVINGNNYYTNEADRCISQGYTAAHVISPKISNKKEMKYSHLKFHDRIFHTAEDIRFWLETCEYNRETTSTDSITFDPVTIYEYPLEEGNQWTYRYETADNVPWRIDKQVTGWEEITVEAGDFWAWKINWYNNPFNEGKDWDESIETVEYVTDQGLIKRTWTISGIEVYNNLGELIGTQIYRDDMELVDLSLSE